MATRAINRGHGAKVGELSAQLAGVLAQRLIDAVLPGEASFTPPELEAAARFVLAAASARQGREPAIIIESVSGSAADRFMRIAVINDDMPFLVDSIAATVSAAGLGIDRLVHPVLAVRRDPAGAITDLPEGIAATGERRESMVYLETDRADARQRRDLCDALEATLADVRSAVADWPKMQAVMAEDADQVADAEGAALLRWLNEGMLTQLGHVTVRRDGSIGDALGVCRKTSRPVLAAESFARAFAWFDGGKKAARAPLVVKSNRIANVHRRVPLDLLIVPVMQGGQVNALSVHAGVWTSAALAAAPTQIPRMRTALADLMARFGFNPSGHAGKALVHALTALPHDLLIGFSDSDLERISTTMMSLVDRPRPRLALVTAPLKRHLFAFVWLPRDAMSTDTRQAIEAMLVQACDAPVLDWSLQVEGSSLALLRFVLDIRDGAKPPAEEALDARLKVMLRGWCEAVESELALSEEPSRAAAITARYAESFPPAYRSAYGPTEAATDIVRLRRLSGGGDDSSGGDSGIGAPYRGVRLHQMVGDSTGQLRLKLYQRSGALALSDAVPALENFGFRVIEDVPTALVSKSEHLSKGEHLGAIHDFLLALPTGLDAAEVIASGASIESALSAVLNGSGEDDAFNRLIAAVGLPAHQVNLLRAWYRYLRQAGMTFGIATAVDALQGAPEVTRGLLALFTARHDPAFSGDRDTAEQAAGGQIIAGLAAVSAINDDRLLRAYRALVSAILRTNAFAPAGVNALAFKLDSALVPGLPKPLPWREIFIYSPRVEGIHLRAGPVARGGIRWSDRRDDFRTEVLGLMKAQRVKNAVIVPTGAKGGFYPKQLPDPALDRDGWLAEGKASYTLFIRTLLSITDNIVGTKVVHPAQVVIRDGDDPYFVVAADKGTASYSDTANAIAAEHDFWLDDAFASGGSKGYDHKAMGITAKGAWLSVQRHFLELGVDVQTESVRVAGCGDMSGDVFGNGMLLSKQLKLVAAFDHRDIFLDPEPDPASSWEERARMFALPRSSWADYDKRLISTGGGVFARSLKEIPLSPPVQAMLGLTVPSIDPDSLITAILKSPVDLLWFGGIGTYVKAATENNAVVGDPANDALRVDGQDVRARVIGEGANLGCTQAGRIEYALSGSDGLGGRNNTDFIDNSAGVDCSDNEVNIKIALAAAKRAGRLTEPARVKLLISMTDDVGALVLEDNRLQALGLSIASAGGASATSAQLRLIETLEDMGQLDRKTEGLADNETLSRRSAEGQGLTRPELAVLLSSSKLALQEALEHSAVPDDPGMADELLAAFPTAMRTRFKREILTHRLRREIVATRLANRLVNRLGLTHPFELVEEEGATLAQVVAAFVAAEQLLGLPALWAAIESDAMPESARILLFDRVAAATRNQMADLLRAGAGLAPPSKLVGELMPGVARLAAAAGGLLGGTASAASLRLKSDLTAAGAPEALAEQVARLFDLDGAVGLARLATDRELEPEDLTRAFVDLGARLGLDWAQVAAARLTSSDPWDRLLVSGLARDFQQMRLDFLRRGLGRRRSDPQEYVAAWAGAQASAIRQFRALVTRAQSAPVCTPAMLAQIASQARNLLGRT
ncbi:MAG: NAD-glutamate dehydrogenase domain-containing protein [Novosphingobium sp.]